MIRQNIEEPKRGHHAGCWIVLILLISIVGGIVYYLYKVHSDNSKYEAREQRAWMMIEKYDSQDGIDSLRKAIYLYMKRFPNGRHATQVMNIKIRVDSERRDWKAALKHLTVESLEEFVRRHSDGYYRNDASRMIDSLLFVEAKAEDTFQSYLNYLQLYEDGRYADKARERMEELDAGEVSPTELDAVTDLIMTHFDALADNDDSALRSTVADRLDSYLGRENAAAEDVKEYMHSIHSSGDRSIVFTYEDMRVTKSTVSHVPTFTAEFILFETVTRGESNEQKRFLATAVLDDQYVLKALTLVKE